MKKKCFYILVFLCLFTIVMVAYPYYNSEIVAYHYYNSERGTYTEHSISNDDIKTGNNYILHNSPISKDLVVYTAYFDDRTRNGHDNVTIIFVVVNKMILDFGWILGCGVNNIEAAHFLVHSPHENFEMHAWLGQNNFRYETVIVMCYDLPVEHGMSTFVTYKTSNELEEKIYVESEHSLVVPAPRVQPAGTHDITVVTCTKVHDRGVTWFPEFIRYQKTIGVDHVHVSILDTFIKDGGLRDYLVAYPLLHKAIDDGYVSLSVWKEWYDDRKKEVYAHSEILRKLDCIYRFRGTYDYAFPVDTDDFFTPQIPGKTHLQYYIRNYCYANRTASCSFSWIYKYPACGIDGEIGPDGNATRHLKSQESKKQPLKPKSLHSTKALVDATFHDAKCKGCLLPGYKVVDVPESVAYVAHIRWNQVEKPCNLRAGN